MNIALVDNRRAHGGETKNIHSADEFDGKGCNSMSEGTLTIQFASARDVSELTRLFNGYRKFYGQAPAEESAFTFIRDRISAQIEAQVSEQPPVAQYFLAWADSAAGRTAAGFMHLIPSTNTLAMRPIWFLEDLYVDPAFRGQRIGIGLLMRAEEFARSTGAERLTLATAHDNIIAQSLYQKLGYVREKDFGYFHFLLK
jgi:ribosomal protein S18 acetylase RimI-like enzyme